MRALVGYIRSLFQEEARLARKEKAKRRNEEIERKLEELRLELRRLRLERASSRNSSIPPQFGERILLLILTKEERVNIPGDLEEEYRGIAAKHGVRFAKLWYYKQVAASAWPLIRKAIRWGILAWVGEWIRRHT
jgi:hypothetical protein